MIIVLFKDCLKRSQNKTLKVYILIKLVPKVYQNYYSFTGMALSSIYNYNFIDACHIDDLKFFR